MERQVTIRGTPGAVHAAQALLQRQLHEYATSPTICRN